MSVDRFVDVVAVKPTDVDRLEQAWSVLVGLQDGASHEGPLGQALDVVMPLLYRELAQAHAFFDGAPRQGLEIVDMPRSIPVPGPSHEREGS